MLLLSCAACDAAPEGPSTSVAPAEIHGGTATTTCGFPTVAMLGSATCTATLIHPELLVYAAHCGVGFSSAHFGESAATGFDRALESCALHPEYTGQFGAEWDYAICRLAEPIEGLPIVPPVMGCETDVLIPGRPVVVVGFGRETEGGGAGLKREMPGVVSSIMYGGTSIAIDNVDEYAGACPGDSGGPTFVELDDGSFRQLGVHHTASASCEFGFGVTDKRLWMSVPWIESATGLDVTPCHDADGTWNPGPSCGGFPTDPAAGMGDWPACGPGPTSGASETCGPPFGSGSGGGDPGATASASGTGGGSGDGGSGGGSATGGGVASGGGTGEGGGDSPSSTTTGQASAGTGASSGDDGDGSTGGGPAGDASADGGESSGDGCSCRSAPAAHRESGALALCGLLLLGLASRLRDSERSTV